jgi:hypothetical protein
MSMRIVKPSIYWTSIIGTAACAAALFAGCGSDETDTPPPSDAGLADAPEASDEPSDGGEHVLDGGALDDGSVPDEDAGPCSADGWCQTELTSPNLEAIWGSGPNDVWAVGWFGTIMHWDGTTWTRFESGTQWPLFGIWGSGPNDVWAVGRYGTVLHWDGTTWSPSPSNTTVELVGVWGNGHGDVWAPVGGDRAMMHKDPAGVWSRVQFASFYFMSGISGAGQNALWFWGNYDVIRWNQAGTGPMESITTDSSFPWWSSTYPWDRGQNTITSVWMAGPSDLWILSQRGDVYNWKEEADGGVTAVQSRVPTSGSAQDGSLKFTSIWGTSPTNVWASGQLGRIVHLENSKWTLSSTAVHGRIFDCTLSLWGANADDVWAVGKCADGRGVALRRHR